MPSGPRDQRIKFQREGTTDDGQGGLVPGWVDVGAVTWARMQPMGGREQMLAMQMQGRSTYRVTIPNRRDIDAGMRIVWVSNGDQLLNIRDMADPGSRAIERTLVVELGGSEHS